MDEGQPQVHNQGSVQGQNIAHYQQITQYFPGTGIEPARPPRPERLWLVPYRRNPFFTGREDVLNRLHEHFTRAKTAALTQPPAITGLGGIGKTQVAVEYAYRYKDDYHDIFWVNATTRETLIEGFVTIARLLALPAKDEQDQRLVVAAVQHWLATHEQWLLILDNADDAPLVSEFLPPGDTGHILLTSREPAWGPLAHSFEVEKMSEAEGIRFLLRRVSIFTSSDAPLSEASSVEQARARAIVQEMDGLPLALDQAGAYIEETPSTLDGYLKAYQRRQQELLQERGNERRSHPDAVATTWSLNFEQVERLSPMAADLLRFLAFLAPDAIPEEMIVSGATELGPQLQAVATDETLLDQPLKVLSRFSLVRRNPKQHLLFIHRLVQAILRATMTDKKQLEWAERTARAVNQAFPDVTDVTLWQRCERLLPHALACADLMNEYALYLPEAASLLNRTGYYLDDHAQYEQAEPLYQRALAIREQILGPEHPNTATSLNNLAELHRVQGRYEEAEPLYQRALAIDEKAYGPNHPDVATDLNNLAGLYYRQGEYEQAELLLKRALAIYEQMLGPEHPNTATSLNNLAALYDSQGQYEEAEPLYQRALAIDEKAYGPNHPDVATDLINLALLYHDQGKYEQAEPLYQRALAIREKMLGPDHPETATILNNLTGLYYRQGKYEQVELLLKHALAIREKMLGPDHPETATSLNYLAALYDSQGQYEEAEPLYQRALAIREQMLGPEHPSTKTARENYTGLLERMKGMKRKWKGKK